MTALVSLTCRTISPSFGTAEVHHPTTRLVTFHPYQPVPFVIPATVATAVRSKSPPAAFQGAMPSALFQVEPHSVELLLHDCTLICAGVTWSASLQSRCDCCASYLRAVGTGQQ